MAQKTIYVKKCDIGLYAKAQADARKEKKGVGQQFMEYLRNRLAEKGRNDKHRNPRATATAD